MKTTKHTITISRVKLIALFFSSVVVFCLLSILTPRASDFNTMNPDAGKDFSRILNEKEHESLLELQDWMLDFQYENEASVIKNPMHVNVVGLN